jgi:hypothetical protein
MKPSLMARSLFGVVPALCLLGAWASHRPSVAVDPNREASVTYFRQMATVLQHPRCLNCHPQGDRPTQGLDLHLHIMNVRRGADDHGAVGLRCAACHGSENNLVSGVPGAPNWGLAPRSMGWVGLSLRDLCLAVKDPKKNHGKTLEQLITHNAEEKLVSWAWHPGPGREPAPGTQAAFADYTRKWVETGAGCPS